MHIDQVNSHKVKIDQANIENLTQLWSAYQADIQVFKHVTLKQNRSWPHRLWLSDYRPDAQLLAAVAEHTSADAKLPIWPDLASNNKADAITAMEDLIVNDPVWFEAMRHTAMALDLNSAIEDPQRPSGTTPTAMQIHQVKNASDIATWVATGSKAFGYTIDPEIIQQMAERDNVYIYTGIEPTTGLAAATGLLFTTGDIAGIHQIGVPATFRGKGYANQMMQALIQQAKKTGATAAVLQASAAGQPVYEKLGFTPLFPIVYLKKTL
ncbi:Uncharacterised protein [BD1-7 clade bacterium]|uniref:N-acetyltransferase domain-containing protein n=1 Tax=BD1-7 clade bacterium TaxID=2029982 RepID=A0A5S9PKX5_9GAMM|nr:Uncharacterised protein [BD1-7 clade bacterium]CAA0104611.1 Uncharacterised protein [BD1-7 clade bacterium]